VSASSRPGCGDDVLRTEMTPCANLAASAVSSHAGVPRATLQKWSPFNSERSPLKSAVKTPALPAAQDIIPEVDITFDEATTIAPLASATAGASSTPTVLRLDPSEVYAGKGPNRLEEAFDSDEYAALSDSIMATHGNLQPITVNLLPTEEVPPGTQYRYILVSGARRLRACLENRIPVLALVGYHGSLPPEMVRAVENQLREPLKPIEFGRQLQAIVTKYPHLSKRAIARVMGRDSAQIERCLDIAELPAAIVDCFMSPGDIRTNDATPLKQALERANEAVLVEAEEIRKGPPLKAAEVVKRLSEAAAAAAPLPPGKARRKGDESFITSVEVDGHAVGEMKQDRSGRQVITLDVELNGAQRRALNLQLERFVREKILGQKQQKKGFKAVQPAGEARPPELLAGAVQ
jgi:ParB/RepB/Spo0J family partition protein